MWIFCLQSTPWLMSWFFLQGVRPTVYRREAISVGLPMIISDQIGCVGPNDAARDRQNAIVYPAGDIKALANGIYSLAGDESLLKRMGDVSLRVAEELNSIISVKGFMRAVHSLC